VTSTPGRRLGVALATVAASLLVSFAANAQRRHGGPSVPAAPAAATAEPKPTKATTIEVNLVVGENKTLPAADVASYSVGASGIADVKVTPDQN